MPDSWLDGEEPSPHQQGTCHLCGLISAGPMSVVQAAITTHFTTEHPWLSLVVEGSDFWIEEAPLRCDVCNVAAEPPWWTHTTDRPLLEIGDADGSWLVCDPCHDLMRRQRRSDLIKRNLTELERVSTNFDDPQVKRDMRRYVSRHLTLFIDHADAGVRSGP